MFYVIEITYTKKVSTEYTQKEIKRESKYANTHMLTHFTETQRKEVREEKRDKSYKRYRKQLQNSNSRSFHISNCFKCKWIILPNKKT